MEVVWLEMTRFPCGRLLPRAPPAKHECVDALGASLTVLSLFTFCQPGGGPVPTGRFSVAEG